MGGWDINCAICAAPFGVYQPFGEEDIVDGDRDGDGGISEDGYAYDRGVLDETGLSFPPFLG